MSLRNRARSLQRKTGLSYQQALAKLRALGDRPAKLHRQSGWALDVCDRFLVDGHAPIDVLEVVRSEHETTIDEVCETLRASSNARAVILWRGGRLLARAGGEPGLEPSLFALMRAQPLSGSGPIVEVWEDQSGMIVYTTQIKRALLIVKFHRDESSLGLVRLRARRAAEELEGLLGDDDKLSGLPPIGGSGGPSGIPHELRVVEPIPAERPKPKPTPIGRRKKR
jgi:hypothetical protein